MLNPSPTIKPDSLQEKHLILSEQRHDGSQDFSQSDKLRGENQSSMESISNPRNTAQDAKKRWPTEIGQTKRQRRNRNSTGDHPSSFLFLFYLRGRKGRLELASCETLERATGDTRARERRRRWARMRSRARSTCRGRMAAKVNITAVEGHMVTWSSRCRQRPTV